MFACQNRIARFVSSAIALPSFLPRENGACDSKCGRKIERNGYGLKHLIKPLNKEQ